MKRIQTLLTAFAISAPLVVSGVASAQAAPASVFVEAAQQAQTVFVQPAQQAPIYAQATQLPPGAYDQAVRVGMMQRVDKTGTVQAFLTSGRRLRGVTLTDGTTVLLRRGGNGQLRRLRPGAMVRVRGFALFGNATVIRNASIVAMRMPRFPAPPPVVAPAPQPPPVVVTPAPATPVAMRSAIRSVQWGQNGLPQMLILANGQQIHLTNGMARALAQRGIHIGERVAITMHTTASSAFVADSLTFSDGATINAATASNPHPYAY